MEARADAPPTSATAARAQAGATACATDITLLKIAPSSSSRNGPSSMPSLTLPCRTWYDDAVYLMHACKVNSRFLLSQLPFPGSLSASKVVFQPMPDENVKDGRHWWCQMADKCASVCVRGMWSAIALCRCCRAAASASRFLPTPSNALVYFVTCSAARLLMRALHREYI